MTAAPRAMRDSFGGDMTKDEFREAVWMGLGRAIVWAQNHDVREFRDVILDAWLNCRAIDPQFEGTRAPFMLELVNLLPDKSFYREELLRALPVCGDNWDGVQCFRLAYYLAIEGDEEARSAMYASFSPGPRMGETIGGMFTELAGIDGFLFAAEKIGNSMLPGREEPRLGELIYSADERINEVQMTQALLEAGKLNAGIEAYRLKVLAKKLHPEPLVQEFSYSKLKPKLLALKDRHLPWWGRKATAEDLNLAAVDFMNSTKPEEQLCYLRIFSGARFPLDAAPLIKLVQSPDAQVVLLAASALEQIEHPELRELALRQIEIGSVGRESSICILVKNWEMGDQEIVLRLIEQEQDRDILHSYIRDMWKVFEVYPDEAFEVRVMRVAYERCPCNFCRINVVSRLIELDALPAAIRAECAFDSNDEIRVLVGAG